MASPKKFVMWSEPAFFKVAQRGYTWPPGYAHYICAAVPLFFLVLLVIFPIPNDPSIYLGVPAMGLAFGLLAGYGLSFIDVTAPATVAVDVAGVSRLDSGIPLLALTKYRMHVFHWPQIAAGELAPALDERLTHILTIFDEQNHVLDRLGVTPSVEVNEIRLLFEQQDKRFTETATAV